MFKSELKEAVLGKIYADEVDPHDYAAVIALLGECVSNEPLQFWQKHHAEVLKEL